MKNRNIMKKFLWTVPVLLITLSIRAQGFPYKALITDNQGIPLSNQNITVFFDIYDTANQLVYSESHAVSTDDNGIVSVNIGEGNVINGNFNGIDWSVPLYSVEVRVDTNGSGTVNLGRFTFGYVPYAKYTDKAGNAFSGDFNDLTNIPNGLSDGDDVNDADHDPANELQTLSINGNQLSISNGNTVTLPATGDNWGSQTVQSDNSLSGDGTSANPLSVNTSSPAFDGWDKDASDDFSGDFNDLTNIPPNLDTDSTDDVTRLNDLNDAITKSEAIYLGENSGINDNLSNSSNTAVGFAALENNSSGDGNVAVGNRALQLNTSGSSNTAFGTEALKSNTTGYSNVAIGIGALNKNTDRNRLVAVGDSALYNNISGFNNTAVGSKALYGNTSGYKNSAFGYNAMKANTMGVGNSAFGSEALPANTTGYDNSAFGVEALYSNTTGYGNSAFGVAALNFNTTGKKNSAFGVIALYSNTTGSYNSALGYGALESNTTGEYNTAVGIEALNRNTTAHYNTAIGMRSLRENTTGYSNTAVGSDAMNKNQTGFRNIAVGTTALYNLTDGDYNTAMGYRAYYNGNYNNSTAIGNGAQPTANDQVRLGNASVTSIGGYANWSNLSDGRFKTDVRENVPGLALVKKLRPVTYHLDMEALARFQKIPDSLRLKKSEAAKAAELQIGFVAQEVEQAARELGFDFHAVDKPKNPEGHYGLRYAEFVPVLVKAVQEQQEQIESQNRKIDTQEQIIEELKNENRELKARLEALEQKMSRIIR